MQFIKQICVIIVLGALGYAAYTTLTGTRPPESPVDMATAGSPAKVEMPDGGRFAGPSVAVNGPPGGAAPRFAGSATTAPPAAMTPPPVSGGGLSPASSSPGTATIVGVHPDGSAAPYPDTNVQPAPYDAPFATPAARSASLPTGGATAALSSAGDVQRTSATMPAIPTPPVGSASGPGTNPPAPGASPASNATGTAGSSGQRLTFEQIQALLDKREAVAALEAASRWFDDPSLPPEHDREVMKLLDTLGAEVIYSRNHLLEKPHTVGQGESLAMIAARYGVTPELLAKINGIADPLYLPPGTQLKVLKGPFDALVDKDRRRLTLFLDGMYAGSFPIGLGRDRPNIPDDYYSVRGKSLNPPYQGPDISMSADDPNNPLGERWMDLGGGLGIHGTNDPQNYLSEGGRGLIRLSPRDAEDVFDILTVGSQVIVRP